MGRFLAAIPEARAREREHGREHDRGRNSRRARRFATQFGDFLVRTRAGGRHQQRAEGQVRAGIAKDPVHRRRDRRGEIHRRQPCISTHPSHQHRQRRGADGRACPERDVPRPRESECRPAKAICHPGQREALNRVSNRQQRPAQRRLVHPQGAGDRGAADRHDCEKEQQERLVDPPQHGDCQHRVRQPEHRHIVGRHPRRHEIGAGENPDRADRRRPDAVVSRQLHASPRKALP